jgi:hypothetical protein
MIIATWPYSTPPYLECQFIGGSSSVEMASSPYCAQAVVRVSRGDTRDKPSHRNHR